MPGDGNRDTWRHCRKGAEPPARGVVYFQSAMLSALLDSFRIWQINVNKVWITYKINVAQIQVQMKFREVVIWKSHMWQIENVRSQSPGCFCVFGHSINVKYKCLDNYVGLGAMGHF